MLTSDLRSVARGKLLINLNNAVNALSGRTLMEELTRRDYRRIFAAAMREGLDLLGQAEIEPATVGPMRPPRRVAWVFSEVFAALTVDAHATTGGTR